MSGLYRGDCRERGGCRRCVTRREALCESASQGAKLASSIKCVVWDLDGTLWRGSLLEGGAVTLVPQLRDVLVELDRRGILQSVASRNDYEDAWEHLRALGIAEYFVYPQIGWGRKSDSVRVVAERLGFAHEAIAFVDDQPFERAEVAYELPAVRVYDANEAVTLVRRAEFRPAVITADSRNRRAMYQAAAAREQARELHRGPSEDFLRSLRMRLVIRQASIDDLDRVEELTLRTSQMNATGVHYPKSVLQDMVSSSSHRVLIASLTDRFGDYGAIGVVLLEQQPACWRLKLLATSCRVISMGIGGVVLGWIVNWASENGVHLIADFRRTGRNRVMEIAYRLAGFGQPLCAACTRCVSPENQVSESMHLVPTPRRVNPLVDIRVAGIDTSVRG